MTIAELQRKYKMSYHNAKKLKESKEMKFCDIAIQELRNFKAAFRSTLNFHVYDVSTFECLNKRVIAVNKIIEDYERV